MSDHVRFRSGGTEWAVDVRHTRRVLAAEPLTPLPAPLPGVAGLLRGGPQASPLPVLDSLRPSDARHVLELEVDGRRFGLLVDEVLGVVRDAGGLIGPAPGGQEDAMISGTMADALIVDAAMLSREVAGLPAGGGA